MAFDNVVEEVTSSSSEKNQSLLEKYEIPVNHISYEYIGECKNGKELERIVRILRSGQEGSFPHLTSTAEARLALVKPESNLLKKIEPVKNRSNLDSKERNELDDELNCWLGEIKLLERDLKDERPAGESLPKPAVRPSKGTNKQNSVNKSSTSDKEKRLLSFDYAGWDKYDVDTELERINLTDEVRLVEAKRLQKLRKDEIEKQYTKSIVEKSLLTSTEQQLFGVREREKGNEAYHAGDYAEALKFYTSSILLDGDINAYNNRAMTHLKMKNFEKAIKDCNTVLEADCVNVKALLRRGLAFEHLEKIEKALKDYEKVLTIDPTNLIAISSIQKLRKDDDTKNCRLTIEEIQSD